MAAMCTRTLMGTRLWLRTVTWVWGLVTNPSSAPLTHVPCAPPPPASRSCCQVVTAEIAAYLQRRVLVASAVVCVCDCRRLMARRGHKFLSAPPRPYARHPDRAVVRYTCPRCTVRTCSLPCVKRHKSEVRDTSVFTVHLCKVVLTPTFVLFSLFGLSQTGCDGVRPVAAFVTLSGFTDARLASGM